MARIPRLATLRLPIEQLFRDLVVPIYESNEFYPALSFENIGQQNLG